MEKIKDPAMALSIVNTVGLIGSSAYFYKCLEEIKKDVVKLNTVVAGIYRKIGDMDKKDVNTVEVLENLNRQVKSLNEAVEELPSVVDVEQIDEDIDEIVKGLEEKQIIIERAKDKVSNKRSDRRGVNVKRRTNVRFAPDNRRKETVKVKAKEAEETENEDSELIAAARQLKQ